MKIKGIISFVLLVGLMSCRSHHKTVIRPSAGQEIYGHKTTVETDKTTTANLTKSIKIISDVDVDMGKRLTDEARRWLGVKYKYGGETKAGADCSGMLMTIFNEIVQVKLPRNSAEQCDYCIKIQRKDLQCGDLVFFSTTKGSPKVTHVGLYVGDGKMIHASTSRGVTTNSINEKYFTDHFHSAGRVYAITTAALGKKPVAPAKMAEISLDEFIRDTQGATVPSDTVIAEDQVLSDAASEIENAVALLDSIDAHTPHPAAAGKVEKVEQNDSLQRAKDIRQSVNRAMKFGK